MYVHTRERDRRPGFDGVKIKCYYYYLVGTLRYMFQRNGRSQYCARHANAPARDSASVVAPATAARVTAYRSTHAEPVRHSLKEEFWACEGSTCARHISAGSPANATTSQTCHVLIHGTKELQF